MDHDPSSIPQSSNHRKRWWEDGDRAGSVAATIVLVGLASAVAIFLLACAIAFFMWAV